MTSTKMGTANSISMHQELSLRRFLRNKSSRPGKQDIKADHCRPYPVDIGCIRDKEYPVLRGGAIHSSIPDEGDAENLHRDHVS